MAALLPIGGAQQQSAHGLDERGERLVLGEPAQPGRHRVGGDEPAAEERQEHQGHGRGCWRSRRSWPTRPSATDSQVSAKVISARTPTAASHSTGVGGGPEPDEQRDADDDGQAQHGLDHAADDVSGQHRGAGDGHGAEPGDDALGHVHGDRDRRPGGPGGHGRSAGSRARRSRGTRPGRRSGRRARRPACRRTRRRTAAGRRPACRRASASWTGSGACAGGCGAASSPSRPTA